MLSQQASAQNDRIICAEACFCVEELQMHFCTNFVLFGAFLWKRKINSVIVKSTRKLSKKFTGR